MTDSKPKHELPKTNNHVEGWHRRMRAAVNACHPSIWKFIEVLQHDHALFTVATAQAVGGTRPNRDPRSMLGVKNEFNLFLVGNCLVGNNPRLGNSQLGMAVGKCPVGVSPVGIAPDTPTCTCTCLAA